MAGGPRVSRASSAEPRTVLITGGANGLGAALVRHFTSIGDQVAVADTDLAAGQELAGATGCLFVATDVGVYAENQAAVRATIERYGRLDAVCLNAGIPGGTSIGAGFDPQRYRRGMQVNVDGVVYGINAALPHLRDRGGAILITSSIAGLAPAADLYYSAAKHALIGLARSLVMLLHEDNITVNVLCPGFLDTRIIAPVRQALTEHDIAIAAVADMAAAAATILDSPDTGQAWEVQAGRPPALVDFPTVTLSRTTDQARHSDAGDDPHGPERRMS
jgi:NAD(P)-dependent dehydrogenase (short-subunit alcohol dehydrogenase family)